MHVVPELVDRVLLLDGEVPGVVDRSLLEEEVDLVARCQEVLIAAVRLVAGVEGNAVLVSVEAID